MFLNPNRSYFWKIQIFPEKSSLTVGEYGRQSDVGEEFDDNLTI